MDFIIKLKDVSVSLDEKPIIHNLNGVVGYGDSILISGRSGCGKSILLKTISGLLYASDGSVVIREVDIRQATSRELSYLHTKDGFVFQDSALISNLTVFNNIALPLRYHNIYPEEEIAFRVDAILKLMKINDIAVDFPALLSYSEKKMVAIARAIIGNPDLIFMDEPLSGLDKLSRDIVIDLIKQLKEKGRTIIIISQISEELTKLLDTLWVLKKGSLYLQKNLRDSDTLKDILREEDIEEFFEK